MSNISEILTNSTHIDILKIAGELGKDMNIKTYIVGGYLRDAILGRKLKETAMLRKWDSFDEPLVLIDSKANMGAIKLVNNEITPTTNPGWLNNFVLTNLEDRKIMYGDKQMNATLNRHQARNHFQSVARAERNWERKEKENLYKYINIYKKCKGIYKAT